MAQKFIIKLNSRDPKTLVEKAQAVLAADSIVLDGNEVSGIFDGKHVHGQYLVVPDEIVFTVNSKPIFLSEDEVETWFKEAFV